MESWEELLKKFEERRRYDVFTSWSESGLLEKMIKHLNKKYANDGSEGYSKSIRATFLWKCEQLVEKYGLTEFLDALEALLSAHIQIVEEDGRKLNHSLLDYERQRMKLEIEEKVLKSFKNNLEENVKLKERYAPFFPRNEMGIIYLFSRYHDLLGFEEIKEMRTEYPDCIALRKGKEERIEFEYYSSGFLLHIERNQVKSGDICVCWLDDVHLPVETITLKNWLLPEEAT